ncbi:biopolymer transporter Tol (plasmid) [Arthrobacter sp. ERGS1:01]|uniref:TolB family protein n=1 Tax=Arthrobacter sp. ERGS1:01 TaxID=1704044 RepID=UPI0006B63FED|nr:PD40 domain-containing protein [Arthrobacter sp. ERGS1:01]ALE04443.1 biopolymer transporter Tol [Arthrobacter sp. ERGS1:01]
MARQLRDGQRAELWVIDVDTAAATLRLSSDTLLFEAPNWSPDGASLVLNGDGRLFRLGVDDGDLEEIALGGAGEINNDHVISPDGRTAYVSSEDGHIHAVPLGGSLGDSSQDDGGARRVTNDHGGGFRHYLHGVSPDGQLLAYIGLSVDGAGMVRTNVHTIPAAGGPDAQLTDDSFPDDGAEFSPDGQWIYFNSERGSAEPGHAQLFCLPAGGGTLEQLTFDERVNWFPHPSPDGTRIAYVSFPPGTLGHPADVDVVVRVLEADGTVRDLAHVFGGQGTMNVPSWDPTGRRIAIVAYPLQTLPPLESS